MKKINSVTRYSATSFILVFLLSCTISGNNTVTRASAYPKVIEKARKDKKYFVMHSGLDTFAVTSLLVEKNKQEFTVHLNKLDSLRRALIIHPGLGPGKLVHLYMADSTSYTLDEPHTIPLKKVARIEMVNNAGR